MSTKAKKIEMLESYLDLHQRKSMHIVIPTGTHRAFKSIASSYGLSMQEFLQEVAALFVDGDKNLIAIAETIKINKINGCSARRKFEPVGQSIYDILEENDVIRE